MRKLGFITALLMLSTTCGFCELVNAIKAIVHDSVVTVGEVQAATALAVRPLMRQYVNDPAAFNEKYNAAFAANLEQLIEQQLILHEYEQAGYNLPESLIEESIQSRIKENWEDRRSLIQSLQKDGRTYESWHRQAHDQIIIEAMRSQFARRERFISPRRIETYYENHLDDYQVEEQVHLSMIVLNKSGGTNDPTRELARELVQKIKHGDSFGDLAETYSTGSQSHQRGDWGWVEKSVLREELAKVAFRLKPGEVSDPIEVGDACYIMRVEEIKPAHHTPLREVQAEIERTLHAQESRKRQDQWIDRLKRKTFVRLF